MNSAMRPVELDLDHVYVVEAFDREGRRKWLEVVKNALTNEGLDDILDKYYKGSSYSAAHYVGLINNSPEPTLANGDTMASHSGWSELTDYDEAARQAVTWGTVSGQSVSNSANKATFTISNSVSIYGAFLATDDTKGGSSGVLLGHGEFSTVRSLGDGDTLQITATATAARAA